MNYPVNILLILTLLVIGSFACAKESKISELQQASKSTKEAWTKLQQYLQQTSIDQAVLNQYQESFRNKSQIEHQVLDQAVNTLAEQEYLALTSPQQIKISHSEFCEKIEREQDCHQKAITVALEQAAKQGASYVVEAHSESNSRRKQSEKDISTEQDFTETVSMQAKANIVKFEVIKKQIVQNKITGQRSSQVTIWAYVAPFQSNALLMQLRDNYRKQLQPYLSWLSGDIDNSINRHRVYQENIEGVKLELLLIPAGQFEFGSTTGDANETPVRIQSVASFYMSSHEVTRILYNKCIEALACLKPLYIESLEKPVTNISWWQIHKEFLPWLNKQTGKQFRLPTEIEWEFAAQINLNLLSRNICQIANGAFNHNNPSACNDGIEQLTQVKQFKANQYGLFDTLGNAAEWVSDCWQTRHRMDQQINNKWCKKATVKGGSWYDLPYYLRPSARQARDKTSQLDTLGFRLALDIDT